MTLENSELHPVFMLGNTGSIDIQSNEHEDIDTDSDIYPPPEFKINLSFSKTLNDDEEVESSWCLSDHIKKTSTRCLLVEGKKPEESALISGLAPDAYNEMISFDTLKALLSLKKGSIRGILLDQRGVLSGIGGWMADEILLKAKIHPNHPGAELTDEEVRSIHKNITKVIKLAVEANGDPEYYPIGWLYHSTKVVKKGKQRAKTFNFKGVDYDICSANIGGSVAYYIEEIQELPEEIVERKVAEKRSAEKKKAQREKEKEQKEKKDKKEKEKGKNKRAAVVDNSDDEVDEVSSSYHHCRLIIN